MWFAASALAIVMAIMFGTARTDDGCENWGAFAENVATLNDLGKPLDYSLGMIDDLPIPPVLAKAMRTVAIQADEGTRSSSEIKVRVFQAYRAKVGGDSSGGTLESPTQ